MLERIMWTARPFFAISQRTLGSTQWIENGTFRIRGFSESRVDPTSIHHDVSLRANGTSQSDTVLSPITKTRQTRNQTDVEKLTCERSASQQEHPFLELRKVSATGRVQIWRAFIQGAVGTISWGVENGKMQIITRTVTEGKQKRSPQEQLMMELRSLANRKVNMGGYEVVAGPLDLYPKRTTANSKKTQSKKVITKDLDGKQQNRVSVPMQVSGKLPPLPMLAKVWSEDALSGLPADAKLFVQPKLDGLRCIANIETGELWSRARKRFEELEHITQGILDIPDRRALLAEGITFIDGEIYRHGLDFQEITSIARRTSVNPHESSGVLGLYVFDACSSKLSFEQRWGMLQSLGIPKSSGSVQSPIYQCITEQRSVEGFDGSSELKRWTSQGFEGAMVRLSPSSSVNEARKEGVYRNGLRSSCLLKIKQFQQEEYPVREFQKHRELETLGSVLLSLPDGRTFSATPARSAKSKSEMWQNREQYSNPGWIATVQYQDLSRTGIPRFPVLLGFRHKDDR